MPEANRNWGGPRPYSGATLGNPQRQVRERSEYVRRLENLEAQAINADVSGVRAPKALAVMRQRMNFHLWRSGIVQKRVMAAGANEKTPEFQADLKDLEYHLEKAEDVASRIARYESPMLGTIKHIGADDPFDTDVSELPDDRLDQLTAVVIPFGPPSENRPAAQHGAADPGGPAPPTGAGGSGTGTAG